MSRAVLTHFKEVSPRNSEEENAHDEELAKTMDVAHGAASEIVSLGKAMSISR